MSCTTAARHEGCRMWETLSKSPFLLKRKMEARCGWRDGAAGMQSAKAESYLASPPVCGEQESIPRSVSFSSHPCMLLKRD